MFIISVFLLLAIFFLILIYKEKVYAFNFIFPMVAMLILIVLIFNNVTTAYILRSESFYESGFQEKIESLTQEDWEKIYQLGVDKFGVGEL